jgi:SsrA-binding protein
VDSGEVWLFNFHISPYEQGNRFNHDPLRPRKLLLHDTEIRRMIGAVQEKGLTLVPLDVHFSGGARQGQPRAGARQAAARQA